jgi:hypothetical protein
MAVIIDISRTLPRHPTKKYSLRKKSDIKRIVIHTTNWNTTPEVLAKYDITPYFEKNGVKYWNHISRTGCPAITYAEIITNDGRVFKTLPYEEVSWHVGIWNKSSLGVALMYECTNELGDDIFGPSEEALKSLYRRVGNLCLELGLPPTEKHVVGHRELWGTGWFWSKGSKTLRKTCPGLKVDLDDVRDRVCKYVQLILKTKDLYRGKVDGSWGPMSQAAFGKWLVRD